jgi:hypothetical protein
MDRQQRPSHPRFDALKHEQMQQPKEPQQQPATVCLRQGGRISEGGHDYLVRPEGDSIVESST